MTSTRPTIQVRDQSKITTSTPDLDLRNPPPQDDSMLKPTRLLRAEWSSTLNLPKSTLPPRPLQVKKPIYLRNCTDDLYSWQTANRPADRPFVFHDGPPYANGSLHVGHALNKILKDIICRFQLSQGKRVYFIPGWDCHGLPIELKALHAHSEQTKNKITNVNTWMKPLDIRDAARRLAMATIAEQKQGFRDWGVMGDWDNAYQTMEKGFELRQLNLFKKMVESGLIYRQYKPVHWSPSSGTALAEAELEYDPSAISLAAFVKFKIVELSPVLTKYSQDCDLNNLCALIWTTTPWTLPANKAIAVNNEIEYSIVRLTNTDEPVLVATSRLPVLVQDAGLHDEQITVLVEGLLGSDLLDSKYINPLQGRNAHPQRIIHADFVRPDSGTGLVHTAPGHGFDDYNLCAKIGISISAPVDDQGRFTAEALPDEPEALAGKSVLTEGSQAALDSFMRLSESKLGLANSIWRTHKYVHKDAIDWRTKKPVIIRATAQWFADVESIKSTALRALEDVQFLPESGRSRLQSFINGRSQWCISRQRAWGVPIPALFRKDDGSMEAVMTESSVAHIIKVVEDRGIDAWWTDEEDDRAWVPSNLKGSFVRGKDTMDVWFDSGTSWTLLDQSRQELPPADIYLEGSDQHRGWFQSSLLTYVAYQTANGTRIRAPYKHLITHGFTLDENGKKMSKSEGNVISPDEIINGTRLPPVKSNKKQKHTSGAPTYDIMGPDALRLWVASSDYTHDVVVSNTVLLAVNNSLHKYRITLKWLLGILDNFEAAEAIRPRFIDTLALHQLALASRDVHAAYASHEPFKAVNRLNKYVNLDLSSFYFETAKDTLYTGAVAERRAAQATCFSIFTELLAMLSPVVPLLVEEVMDHASPSLQHSTQQHTSVDSPLKRVWTPCTQFINPRLVAPLVWLSTVHTTIKGLQEQARAEKKIGSGLECDVRLYFPTTDSPAVRDFFEDASCERDLASVFVVSGLTVARGEPPATSPGKWGFSSQVVVDGANVQVCVLSPARSKCQRCWRYAVPAGAETAPASEVCERCEGVLRDRVKVG